MAENGGCCLWLTIFQPYMVEKRDKGAYDCPVGLETNRHILREDNTMTFSQQLITLRRQKGLSQEQQGEEIGVTRQTISKWDWGIPPRNWIN